MHFTTIADPKPEPNPDPRHTEYPLADKGGVQGYLGEVWRWWTANRRLWRRYGRKQLLRTLGAHGAVESH